MQPLNPRYQLSRIDLQGDPLQKSYVGLPTLVSPFDSPDFLSDYLDNEAAPAATDPTGIVDKINKGLGSAIGLPGDAFTSGLDSLKRDVIVAGVGLLFLAVGLYAITK